MTCPSDHHRLYHDLAHLWPHLSPPEDYRAEADRLRTVLDSHLSSDASARLSLLELGAGGGHTLHHLRDAFDCVAVDLSAKMLAHCQSLNPGMETHVGDMRDLQLGRTFDVVLIHDAIDYMLSAEDVSRALATAHAHLKPGGLLLVAPTYVAESFVDHDVAHDHTTIDDAPLTYFSYVHDPDPSDTTFEMILLYLLSDAITHQVQVIEDRHTCGLFSTDTWMSLLQGAGFDVQQDMPAGDEAWTLFIGTRP